MAARIILSTAGAGKTRLLIHEAQKMSESGRVLITTYTNRNTAELILKINSELGDAAAGIEVMTWCSFLMKHGVLPYQSHVLWPGAVQGFSTGSVPRWEGRGKKFKRDEVFGYHLDASMRAYYERLSDLSCLINERSQGAVVGRINKIFKAIFVDEIQDLAGYDLTLLEEIMKSSTHLFAVGDSRQATFSTNTAAKNAGFRGSGIVGWVEKIQQMGLCQTQQMTRSWRCHVDVSKFADLLFPEHPKTQGSEHSGISDTGVHLVQEGDVDAYMTAYSPQVLRYDRRANTRGYPAINFGESKGSGYDRVLIFSTKPILEYLKTGDPSVIGSIEKFYVAVTRARYSVGIVVKPSSMNVTCARQWP